ncbi:Uncharacterised protein [Vibrio cholerae]|nr:Uncharacterised protein [Vibrio cholerae]
MELPHFHILHWYASTQSHTDTIARVNVCIGG